MDLIKILCLSDTHLGFDYPVRPRIVRRRRGPDFFVSYHQALKPALNKEVHCVVHGGDIFYRSQVPAGLVAEAFEPLKFIASAGIPVLIVPGNHERSQIPYRLLTTHPNIHIFDRPRTFSISIADSIITFSGFPFYRQNIRSNFRSLLRKTRWNEYESNCRLLCVHQCFDGSTVGPSEFIFKYRPDTIRPSEIPNKFTAVVNGHIHRAQILIRDLQSRSPIPPIIHPGSTERTSFAEKDESKGFFILEITKESKTPRIHNIRFIEIPTRPMVRVDLQLNDPKPGFLTTRLKELLGSLQPDSVVQIRINQTFPKLILSEISAPNLRRLAPETMNVSISIPGRNRRRSQQSGEDKKNLEHSLGSFFSDPKSGKFD